MQQHNNARGEGVWYVWFGLHTLHTMPPLYMYKLLSCPVHVLVLVFVFVLALRRNCLDLHRWLKGKVLMYTIYIELPNFLFLCFPVYRVLHATEVSS